ncbi:MAG: GtrA family protein [Candidatus Hodarchaeales archaeon]
MDDIRKQYLVYLSFAIIAIAINTFSQAGTEYLTKEFIPPLASISITFLGKEIELWFGLALVIGTIAGFVFKFIVDKWIVFKDSLNENESLKNTGKQVTKYFGFAIFTTMIFWGTEGAFYFFLGDEWYLIGGIIGLIIGYTIKFVLDRKYVFAVD